MARAWSETGQTRSDVPPWTDVRVLNSRGKVIADLSRDGERDSEGDPFAVCSLSVEPGAYFLRHRLEGGTEFEQSLIVPTDWFLHVYFLRLANLAGRLQSEAATVVHHAAGRTWTVPFSDPFLTTLETARIALAESALSSARVWKICCCLSPTTQSPE